MENQILKSQFPKKVNMKKIICGDCFEIMKNIEDNSVDMILSDLPYNITSCSWDVEISLTELFYEYNRIIKNDCAICLTSIQPFTTYLINSNLKNYKYSWIWIKNQGIDPFLSKIRPMNNYEEILVFSKSKTSPRYFPQMTVGKEYKITRDKKDRYHEITDTYMKETTTINDGYRVPTRTLYFNIERGLHPTQKPVELFKYLIKTYTIENDLVLDSFAGSCTTAIAALETNRNFLCIEKDQNYCKIGESRMLNFEQNVHFDLFK